MSDDQTPINARPKGRRAEALEDLSLSLRDNLLWRGEDYLRSLGEVGRAIVAGGAVVVALTVGIGGYALASSGGDSAPASTVAVKSAPAPQPEPVEAAPTPKPDPTLQGATPVFKAPAGEGSAEAGGSKAPADETGSAVSTANTGNPATDIFSTKAPAQPAATASGAASVEGPPAGPAAIAVARKFADAFVVYETGAEKSAVRRAFKATASPAVTKALLQRPPRQPAGVKVPKAKVLNVVAAPSHDRLYPVSVSLLRVGATSELRLEMEQLKNKQWRVVNVLG